MTKNYPLNLNLDLAYMFSGLLKTAVYLEPETFFLVLKLQQWSSDHLYTFQHCINIKMFT